MTTPEIRSLASGANQHELRNHNERLILSLIQRHGSLPGSEIARRSLLSPQTVSVILRRLQDDGLLLRGKPQRGKVGKPSVPIGINPQGALSIGLKIGRRDAELLLMNFSGGVLKTLSTTYSYPLPGDIFEFLESGLSELTAELSEDEIARIAGLGIAIPFEIWNWSDTLGARKEELSAWKNVDFKAVIATFSDLTVFIENDATAACRAEQVFGRGKEFKDYAYFYVGSFVGGGIVLNHTVFEGNQGNAGAFGSLPVFKGHGPEQLIDAASLYLLENDLSQAGLDPSQLWKLPLDWQGFSAQLDAWIISASQYLAQASLTVCGVVDFEAILIDGGFPTGVRRKLVEHTQKAIIELDTRGLILPRIEEAAVGAGAMATGAAVSPIAQKYLVDSHVGLFA